MALKSRDSAKVVITISYIHSHNPSTATLKISNPSLGPSQTTHFNCRQFVIYNLFRLLWAFYAFECMSGQRDLETQYMYACSDVRHVLIVVDNYFNPVIPTHRKNDRIVIFNI